MEYKKRATLIILSSLLTAVFAYTLIRLTSGLTADFEQVFGYHLGLLLSFLVAMLIMMAGGALSLLFKPVRSVPRIGYVTMFAAAESYWLLYLSAIPAVSLLGWWAWTPLLIVLIITMYFAADLLFNIWKANLRVKVITAITIVALTAISGDRLVAMLY